MLHCVNVQNTKKLLFNLYIKQHRIITQILDNIELDRNSYR